MIFSKNFENDLKSKDTNLIPLVVIEDSRDDTLNYSNEIYFSTNNVSVGVWKTSFSVSPDHQ